MPAVIAMALSVAAIGAPAPSERDIWDQFVAWYKTYTGSPYPAGVLKAYTAALASAGKSEAEIQAAITVLTNTAANPPVELMRLHFDKVFTLHQDLFSHDPNRLLVRTVGGLKPGTALDAGMGQGRNAVYLATQGWDVTGYDLSGEAIAKALENASKAHVGIHTAQSTHQDFDFGKNRWDLIVMTYSFINMEDRQLLGRIKDSLRPGGRVVIEQPNSGDGSKGPANALFRSFEDLRVLLYEDVLDTAEWSKATARLGRLVAEKDK